MARMKGRDLYALQQQAKQLRAIEEAQAAQAGVPPRKPGLIERLVLGVRRRSRHR